MTESLSRLLLRLSDAGSIVVSGRTLSPWLGRPVEGLLGRRVLVEVEPVTEWAPCSDCDQGCESRTILSRGDGLIAACPHDSRHDEMLSHDDVRAFGIDIESLCHAVRNDTCLDGDDVTRITECAWLLGSLQRAGRSPLSVVLAFALQSQNAADLLFRIRTQLRLDATVVSNGSPSVSVRQQFMDAGINLIPAEDALAENDDRRPFALDPHRLTRPAGGASVRLVIRTAERTVTFDGQPLHVAPQPFDLLVLLARHALSNPLRLHPRDIENALFGTAVHGHSVTDIVRRLRDAFAPFVGGRAAADSLIDNKPRHGYRLALQPHEIDLV